MNPLLVYGGWLAFLASIGIELSPFKINPWSWLFKKIGRIIMEDIIIQIKANSEKLEAYMTEQAKIRADECRNQILIFANEVSRKVPHSKEQYRYMVKKCDDYEEYIEDHGLKNGVVDQAIGLIKKEYSKCLENNDFLD